eukprot:1567599-Rhodomonas_salina.1
MSVPDRMQYKSRSTDAALLVPGHRACVRVGTVRDRELPSRVLPTLPCYEIAMASPTLLGWCRTAEKQTAGANSTLLRPFSHPEIKHPRAFSGRAS